MVEKTYVRKININKTAPRKKKKAILGMLDIELTERCNNNCIHCCINLPENDTKAKAKELSTKQIKDILKEAVSLGCLKVRFTGGEPLLRKDFEELYIFARKLGLEILIFTNATLITSSMVKLFANVQPLKKIEVGVYGMEKKSYEDVTRTPGSFEAAWRGINLLLQKKIPFVVKSSILPSNKTEIEKFEAWAASVPWVTRSGRHAMFFDLRCRRDSESKNKLIKSLRLSPEKGLAILTRNPKEYVKYKKEFCSKFMGPRGDKLFSCGSGIRGGCIDAYGYFQPCLLLKCPDTAYNLKNGSLKDALMNFFPKIRQMKASNKEYLRRCAQCFLKDLCSQCPAKSYIEHGVLDTPVEYFCDIAHAHARYLGLLKKDEKAWEVADWENKLKRLLDNNQHLQIK